MARSASVVVPVKDGARYLEELLAAVRAQEADTGGLEVLVIDSGSSDDSVAIARAAGADVLEIPPADFGHGRTRNLGAERTHGELICFLTQDATPAPGWMAALQESFDLAEHVGAAYGPHLPRPSTSPMIARELEEFFATHSPDGRPHVQGRGGDSFLSNVNAAYARACWEEIRFADVAYSEDQRFGREMLERGWQKVFHPGAAVLHAHDYPPLDFMRRYFDEYRGLRAAIGHVEGFGLRSSSRHVRALVARDREWMRRQGVSPRARARWTARSVLHHSGRKVFSALGSRSQTLPAPVQRRLSLEGTATTPADAPGEMAPRAPRGVPQPPLGPRPHEAILELARHGATPLLEPVDGMAERETLHIAVVIPPFRRGSGGHNSIFQMLLRLERMGHTVSVWVDDRVNQFHGQWPAVTARNIREWFAPLKAPVFHGFDYWYGADVAVATGWQTVHSVLLLDSCRARAYLVQDHESEFFATSAERRWAQDTYGFGLHAITASPWLRAIVERYGGTASSFDFGVDHDVYRPQPVERRRDTVMFYARAVTPRRAVPLGTLALEELRRRRPDVRLVLFGDVHPPDAPFAYEHLGVASPEALALAYSEATVGLCLSMTNYSLIPQEMLACGLPCVDLAGFSAETVFPADGPVELVGFDPLELADAIERLLDSPELWQRRSEQGIDFVAERSWDRSAVQLEAALREALRLRFDRPSAGDTLAAAALDGEPLMTTVGAATDVAARTVPVADEQRRRATARLIERLSAEDVEAVEQALEGDPAILWRDCDAGMRERLLVSFGVWYRIPGVLEKTGLTPDEPPPGVHAMARGPLAAGGDLYTADLVADCLAAAGTSVADVHRALDFGCSSGRTVRALAAAYPEVEWHGVDPNAEAVRWAAEHVPGVRFAVSGSEPPLDFADGTFDLVYAISIWSHFDEPAALAWLEEMRRVIAPGGHLVLTVHGLQSVAVDAQEGARPPGQLEEIRRVLYRRGFWFAPEFGEDGDHGVSHPEWGTSFISPEWLLRSTTPAWDIVTYDVGRNDGNQDAIVLRRPPA